MRTRRRAIVVDVPDSSSARVARLTSLERWGKCLVDLGFEVSIVRPAELAIALRQASHGAALDQPQQDWVLLTWGDFVVNPAALDAFADAVEAEPLGQAVKRIATSELGGGPVFALSTAAAARIADEVQPSWATSPEAFVSELERGSTYAIEPRFLRRGFWIQVNDGASANAALSGLLRELRWRYGGIVAHYLNRPVSSVISRGLADTSITPNQVTGLNFLIGIVGVLLLFNPGGYAGALAGMLILHVNSVVDGVDGELARLRHQTSAYGAMFDSWTDEILNAAMLIGIGYNLANDPASSSRHYLGLGIFAGVVALLYAVIHWHCKFKHGLGFYWWWDAYKPRKKVQASNTLGSYFMRLFQKDGLLFIYLIGAALHLLPVLLWISSAAAAAVLVLLFVHIVIKRARW